MASFTRQLDVALTGGDYILKYTLDASASPLARQPVFTIQELAKPDDETSATYMRVQPAEMRARDKPNQFGFDWKLDPATLHVKIHVYSDLADDQTDDPKLSTFLWEDPEDLTVNGLLNKGPTRLKVWPAGSNSGPQTAPGTLLDKCAASLCLPNSTPNAGCDAGQTQHDRWIQWLANAFQAPVYANKIEGAIDCLQGGKTTCSLVLNVALRHFGIPSKYLGRDGSISVVPMKCKSPYVKTITPDSFPRLGDPYFIGAPTDFNAHAHHAIFGGSASQNPPQVGSYSGGWAPPKAPMSRTDAGPYSSPSPLALGADGTFILIGAPPDAHGLGGNQKKIWWYADMWAFFRDHSDEIKPATEGLA